MTKRLCFLVVLSFLLLSGCVQTKILEDDLLIQAEGFDQAGKNELLGTFGYANYLASSTSGGSSGDGSPNSPQPQFLQAKGRTVIDISMKIAAKAALPVEEGQLQAVLFGKQLAGDGLRNLTETLLRDPQIGEQLYLAVTEGTAAHILTGKYKGLQPVPSMYISKLLKQNIKKMNLPTTNLHVFSYHLFNEDMDPVLPLIRKEGDKLDLEGLALFDYDRYVGKLGLKDMFVFKRLYENTRSGQYEVNIPNKGSTIVRQITSHKSYDVRHAKSDPSVAIHVKINGMVDESMNRLNFDKQKAIKLVEQTMEKQIEQRGKQMVKRFQKLGIDPFGIGSKVRSHDRTWTAKKWKDLYPNVGVNIKVDVKIKDTGTIN